MIHFIGMMTVYLLTRAVTEALPVLLALVLACIAVWSRRPELRRRAWQGLSMIISLQRARSRDDINADEIIKQAMTEVEEDDEGRGES